MNRIFHAAIVFFSAILALFFLALIVTAILELGKTGFVRSPKADEVLFAARLSLFTATAASLLALLISLPVAYLLSRYHFPGKGLLDTLLDLPIVLSPIALGAMLLVFFNTPWGRAIEDHFGPFVFEVKGIILAQFCVVTGLSLRLLKTAFDGVDIEYENLARTLGYNRLRVFLRVILPLSRKGIVAAFLLTWARAIGEFGATVTLAGATPFKTETMPVAISLSFASADISSALIFILILTLASLGVLYGIRKIKVLGYE